MPDACQDCDLLKAMDAMEAQGYRPVLVCLVNDDGAVQTLSTDDLDILDFIRFLADEAITESWDVEPAH
jgi:hypothetical protein